MQVRINAAVALAAPPAARCFAGTLPSVWTGLLAAMRSLPAVPTRGPLEHRYKTELQQQVRGGRTGVPASV